MNRFVLQALEVSVRRGRHEVLHSVSCAVRPGELLGLVGRNGGGKSTLLRTLAGFLPLAAGTVQLLGRPASSYAVRERARVLPFFLDEQPRGSGGAASQWPRPGVTRLDLPNRHLEYALTWYGLAGTLIAVYLAFAVGRLRRSAHNPNPS